MGRSAQVLTGGASDHGRAGDPGDRPLSHRTQERTMSTLQTVPAPSPARTPVRNIVRWVRETPAPEWEAGVGRKATVLGYVGASMALWTVVGVSGSAGVGWLIRVLVG
jgi:hypothetical protein